MVPVSVRIIVVLIGFALLIGSWFVGNTVDMARVPTSAERGMMLQRDALTLSMRGFGAFIIVVGLLMWVIAEQAHRTGGFF